MPHRLLLLAICLGVTAAATEPAPRAVSPAPFRVGAPLTHVSAARELADGRVIVTNGKQPSVLIIDPVTGTASELGRAGGGTDRFARPGGLYGGPSGTTLLFDRGQIRVFTITPAGELQGSRSVARRGVTSASDADVDLQRVDARGFTYFLDRHAGVMEGRTDAPLVRFNAETQTGEEIARLRKRESRQVGAGDNVVFSREVIGSPADGWDVAPDGRVAVVRADPYRVEWLAPDGGIVRGPVVEYGRIPFTDADRRRHRATRGSVGVGLPGGARTDAADLGLLFAPHKPPFEPGDVMVSPDARVWVLRTQPADVRDVVYDVFDSRGARVDRILLPPGSRIVGFGPRAAYVRHDSGQGCELKRYLVGR